MRICVVPEYPLNLMPGGLQVQAAELAHALNQLPSTEAALFSWSDKHPPADLYHFVGLQPSLHQIASLIHKHQKHYVITLLIGCCTTKEALKASLRRAIGRRISSQVKLSQRTIDDSSHIIAIVPEDVPSLRKIFSIPENKISVVPHGVLEAFFNPSPILWRETFPNNDFLLCVGAIQPRKNQLLAAKAANQLKLPIMFLGPFLHQESTYNHEFLREIEQNKAFGGVWIPNLINEDPLLHSAYAACKAFVLLSVEETQPISVLQAMAASRPVLLGPASYTAFSPFSELLKIKDYSLEAAVKGMKEIWERPRPVTLGEKYKWPRVAEQLRGIYTKIINHDC